MSNEINTCGPAFPAKLTGPCEAYGLKADETQVIEFAGMTLRQYAAIFLKVPNSGTNWLDEMIEEANKLDKEMLTSRNRSNTL